MLYLYLKEYATYQYYYYQYYFFLKVKKQPPEVFHVKAVLKNFAMFTEKQLCRSLFLLKRDSNTGASL